MIPIYLLGVPEHLDAIHVAAAKRHLYPDIVLAFDVRHGGSSGFAQIYPSATYEPEREFRDLRERRLLNCLVAQRCLLPAPLLAMAGSKEFADSLHRISFSLIIDGAFFVDGPLTSVYQQDVEESQSSSAWMASIASGGIAATSFSKGISRNRTGLSKQSSRRSHAGSATIKRLRPEVSFLDSGAF